AVVVALDERTGEGAFEEQNLSEALGGRVTLHLVARVDGWRTRVVVQARERRAQLVARAFHRLGRRARRSGAVAARREQQGGAQDRAAVSLHRTTGSRRGGSTRPTRGP